MTSRRRTANDNIPVDAYSVTVERLLPEDGGGFLARVPELPGCTATGETAEAALKEVRDAIRSWILTAREFADPVPAPSSATNFSGKWVQRVPRSLHRRLADRARHEGVSLNTLAATLLAQGLGEPVGRLAQPRRASERKGSR